MREGEKLESSEVEKSLYSSTGVLYLAEQNYALMEVAEPRSSQCPKD